MSNKSNILPQTTHVHIDAQTFSSAQIDWCRDHAKGRTDIFAYVEDDYLDYNHIRAVIDGNVLSNWFAPTEEGIEDWYEMLDGNGQVGTILFAFEDNAAALLFKLTFGGAA